MFSIARSNAFLDDMDRTNSVLTDKQREFLRATADERADQYSKQMNSYHWRNIRERIWNAFRDFRLLAENLTDDERRMMLELVGEGEPLTKAGEGKPPNYAADNLFPGVVAFLYQHEENPQAFAETIESGVELAIEKEGWFSAVNVDIDVDRTYRLEDVENADIAQSILEGGIPETMTRKEYDQMTSMLTRAGAISPGVAIRMQAIADGHDFIEDRREQLDDEDEAREAFLDKLNNNLNEE